MTATPIELITKFYESFSKLDADSMLSCYDSEIEFKDPAFGILKGDDVKTMWRMLISRSKGNLKITFNHVHADHLKGTANWKAEYVYSQTGRNVINCVVSHFEFKNDKIIKHTDHFDLWKWTQQAFGWKGYLFGWTRFMKAKIQKQTAYLLNRYKTTRAD